MLDLVGVGPIFFLSSEGWAMFSVILIKVWRSFPFMMVSCLAALQSIDQALYEAAKIDGASRWQSFRDITFPQIRGISVVMWILMTIWSVNDFETPWLLTQAPAASTSRKSCARANRRRTWRRWTPRRSAAPSSTSTASTGSRSGRRAGGWTSRSPLPRRPLPQRRSLRRGDRDRHALRPERANGVVPLVVVVTRAALQRAGPGVEDAPTHAPTIQVKRAVLRA